MYQSQVNMSTYGLDVALRYDLTRHLDGQPLQFMMKDRWITSRKSWLQILQPRIGTENIDKKGLAEDSVELVTDKVRCKYDVRLKLCFRQLCFSSQVNKTPLPPRGNLSPHHQRAHTSTIALYCRRRGTYLCNFEAWHKKLLPTEGRPKKSS